MQMRSKTVDLENARMARKLEALLLSVEGLIDLTKDPATKQKFQARAQKLEARITALRHAAHQ
jgi:hypothetical protein